MSIPEQWPSQSCHNVTVSNGTACFTNRWPDLGATKGIVSCQPGLIRRDGNDLSKNLTKIADTLASMTNQAASSAGTVAEQGMSFVGCAAEAALAATVAYYFNQAQKELSLVLQEFDLMLEFFGDIFQLATQVTDPIKFLIDDTDKTFQELICYVDTSDGTAISRTLTQHSTLHVGLNALASIQGVASLNIVSELLTLLTQAVTGVFTDYEQYITAQGSLVLGWTQAMRLCKTKWEFPDLENPEQQDPEEDDEDEWLPRYEIYTKAGTPISVLRGLEHALGGEGEELTTQDNDGSLIMGYVVDLNIMQATLPMTMPFINWTLRFVWDGGDDDSLKDWYLPESGHYDGASPSSTKTMESSVNSSFARTLNISALATVPIMNGLSNSTHAEPWNTTNGLTKRQDPWNPDGYLDPIAFDRQRLGPVSPGHWLKSLCQEKGQNLASGNAYVSRDSPPRGQGS